MSTKRKLVVIALWGVVAALTFVAAGLQNPFTGLFLLLCVFAACSLGGIYAAVKVWGKPLITVVLIATMAALPAVAEPTNNVAKPAPQMVQPQCNPIMGGMILAIGIAVVWGIYKLCKKLDKMLPPPPPPNPPPPPPPNVNTNTNAMPHMLLQFIPASNFQMPDISSNVFDISDGGFKAPDGSTYTNLLAVNLECSTNFTDWTRYCSVTQWCAMSGYCLTVLYDGQGNPLYSLTNNATTPFIPDFTGCMVPTNSITFLRASMVGN